MKDFLSTKCRTETIAEEAMEMVVAQAAPSIPQSNTKMKSGSRIMFSTAPPARMNIDFFG